MLKLDGRNWCMDEEKLKEGATDIFSNLYTKKEGGLPRYPFWGLFAPLSEEDQRALTRSVTAEEVKEAVFDIGAKKAPGSDGLTELFYQSRWSTIGESVTMLVQDAFTSGQILEEINTNYLSLFLNVSNRAIIVTFAPSTYALCCTK